MKQLRNLIISFVLFVLLFIFVIFLPYIFWTLKSYSGLKVSVYDKTVPTFDYREHKSIYWILNHFKYCNKFLDYRTDFWGFHLSHDKKHKIKNINKNILDSDIIYLADTYGVYHNSLPEIKNKTKKNWLVYGGLNKDDIKIIEKAVEKGILLISEFNTFNFPTPYKVRKRMEKILNLRSTDWTSRYYDNLDRNLGFVEKWRVDLYDKIHKTKWKFKGEGFVVTHGNYDIFVLSRADLSKPFPELSFDKNFLAKTNAVQNTPYTYIVEWVIPDKRSKVLGKFNFFLSDSGKKKFKIHKLPEITPAIILNKQKKYKSYYFAGDFADQLHMPFFIRLSWIEKIFRKFSLTKRYSTMNFFWKVYVPIIQYIFENEIKK